MNLFWQIVYLVFWFLWAMLICRIIVDFVRMFARGWVPSGRSAIAVEGLYTVTDPPVKLLRRIIPNVRIGGVALDLSLLILLLLLGLLILPIIGSLALRAALA